MAFTRASSGRARSSARRPLTQRTILIGTRPRRPLNALVFLLLLFWSFLGVSIGADVFMMAIDYITSAETTVKIRVDGGCAPRRARAR